MKSNEDKNIEKLIEKMMKATTAETPSFDFTSSVMSEVLAIQKKKSISYKPVISKKAWYIIFASMLALFAYLALTIKTASSGINIDLSKFLKPFPGLQISSVTANVLLMAILMLFIQMVLLKSYFNKRFEK